MSTAKGSWVKSSIKLSGKTAVITGSNSGIGFETALDFVKRDARVILACRNLEKALAAKRKIVEISKCREESIVVIELDLASFASVRKFVEHFKSSQNRLDILVNNAGVMMCPQAETEDGIETHLQVNHLGHFLLTNLLLDLLKRSAPSRVVNVSSILHHNGTVHWDDLNLRKNFAEPKAYYQSKLMNVLFTRRLAQLLQGTNVNAYSVHPGYVETDICRHLLTPSGHFFWKCKILVSKVPLIKQAVWRSAKHGAQTSIYCAIAPELEGKSGGYYSDCRLTNESAAAKRDEDAKRLWTLSARETGLDASSEGALQNEEICAL